MYFVQSLHIYPVKSAQAVTLESSALDRFGLVGDRRWMLTDAEGRFVTQRDMPQLTELQVQLVADGLVLSRADARIAVPVPKQATRVPVTVWGDTVSAADAGDAVAHWLATVFRRTLRLVYMPVDSHRAVDPDYARSGETVSFADGFPLLLVSAAA
ncbi:MAG: MOSC N-terminal beta barrel domain-containing protein, partial [Halieaceae bacterium]|nr:MOSC N-terminal beta barrel domain-containing protein [Halieaceae bacterium]